MKYIRTKDGKIIECFDDGIIADFDTPRPTYVAEDYILKQADTIEELCDEFVVKDNDCNVCYLLNDELKYAIQYHEIEDLNVLLNDLKMQNETCYGAIWTNKGLIYVAKMNDKGGLELL